MQIHELKTWPTVFEEIKYNSKTFEYRKNDRNFMNGDLLVLKEWSPDLEEYSGRIIAVKVTSILYGEMFGVPSLYCVMSIKKV